MGLFQHTESHMVALDAARPKSCPAGYPHPHHGLGAAVPAQRVVPDQKDHKQIRIK